MKLEFNNKKPLVYYFFDPLCGWCYGFGPVMMEFYRQHKAEYNFEIVSGGMLVGNRIKPIGSMKDFLLQAYKQVEKTTGITFGDGFLKTLEKGTAVYSSVEPSIALEVFKSYQNDEALAFAHDLQKAIYFDGIEPAEISHYKSLAEKWNIKGDEFVEKMKDPAFLEKAEAGFRLSKQLGVSGFPAILIYKSGQFHQISEGFTSLTNLNKSLSL